MPVSFSVIDDLCLFRSTIDDPISFDSYSAEYMFFLAIVPICLTVADRCSDTAHNWPKAISKVLLHS